MKKSFHILIVFGMLVNTVSAVGFTDPAEKVKVAFVYQFTKYISWPEHSSEKEFIITLVGKSSLLPYMEELASQKKVKNLPIRLHKTMQTDVIPKSHIIILGMDNRESVQEVLRKLKGTNALVIGEGEGLGQLGVCINFYLNEEGKLRFEVNRTAAEEAGITLGSQLLKLARIVE